METAPESLTRFADGVWLSQDPVRIVGMPLTSTMTVLRLGDGGLLLYSPVAMTAERRAAVEALGSVTHLYYGPAQTLLVADLVHNVGRPNHAWSSVYTRAMGFYDRVALSRAIKWTGFDDRRAARSSIDQALSRGFERLVVGHGEPLREGARDLLAAAYDWLDS